MADVVLRVRLTTGTQLDVIYEEPGVADVDVVVDHVIGVLAEDSGVLRTRHGDRLLAIYGRSVATIEVAPRGAVL